VFGILTLVSAVLSASLQATPPALPRLALDSYPPAARATLSRIYEEAAAHPDSVRAVGALARMLHAWELWDAAHQAYERAQSLDPQAFEWRYLDAIVLQRLARHAEAAVQLRLALAEQPTNLPARVKLAEALLDAGTVDESKTLFAALVREPAAEPVAELNLGRIAAGDRRHDVAIVHLERAVKLFPEFGAAHYALARSYSALGRSDDARRALALHAQYGPRWPALDDDTLAGVLTLKDDARAQVQRGMKLADRGDIEGAIAAHEAALARDPSLAQAHSNLISLYGRAKAWAKAEEHYRAIVALGVNLGDAHYDYGVLLGLQEQWDLAANAYRAALAVNPHHAQAHNNLGQILERQRKVAEAADAYRRAVESQPGFRLARFNLGRMLIALGRPDEAVSELVKIAEPRDAEAPRYLFALGVAHVHAGRKDEGIRWTVEAKRLALEFGQNELAAAIDRDLATLK
jgi:tetratricopeptide (TPR) repeat protein